MVSYTVQPRSPLPGIEQSSVCRLVSYVAGISKQNLTVLLARARTRVGNVYLNVASLRWEALAVV